MWCFSAIWLLPLMVVQAQDVDHLLSDVLFCQPQAPRFGLLKMFHDDQMFTYNFSDHSAIPQKGEFEKWAGQSFPNPTNISYELELCQAFLEVLTEVLENITPEAKADTQVTVLTAHPVTVGSPNTLICFVGNMYPPVLTITWYKNDQEVTEGITYSGYSAVPDPHSQTFSRNYQTFSYLNFTPHSDDTYTCIAHGGGQNATSTVRYWVADSTVPSDLLENVLCGLGIGLGVLFLIVGIVFFYLASR
ncbi:HLA class II histocompatibility antigen, DM alpha chain isoform X1 [Pelobates cultripes]|uniref:HLA class II histocompatibility antigen, DM alpha chain isoform X1 n=2 Tax=Pelobates cultripes TaxID=61616 RepID=A0AAD1SZ97_PELCU|nr:HLA class II histocompatibility antigen, DM alpha chain isoform X1 [Pelobates cultripes]